LAETDGYPIVAMRRLPTRSGSWLIGKAHTQELELTGIARGFSAQHPESESNGLNAKLAFVIPYFFFRSGR